MEENSLIAKIDIENGRHPLVIKTSNVIAWGSVRLDIRCSNVAGQFLINRLNREGEIRQTLAITLGENESISIGRDSKSTLRILDPFTSRHHAEIICEEGTLNYRETNCRHHAKTAHVRVLTEEEITEVKNTPATAGVCSPTR